MKILFAEDDALVRLATVDMLEIMGYEVAPAADTAATLALLDTFDASVMLVDINLAGEDGRTLAAEALARKPGLKLIFATGRDPGDLLTNFPGCKVLEKPYGMPELKAMLESIG
jgi:DNA-binding response OmpR family regulator